MNLNCLLVENESNESKLTRRPLGSNRSNGPGRLATIQRNLLVVIASVILFCGTADAQDSPAGRDDSSFSSRAQKLMLGHCFTLVIEDVDVPARETGPLRQLLISEGQWVQESQLLAVIDDTILQRKRQEAEAKLKAAEKKAASAVEVEYARAALDVAQNQWSADYELRKKGSISQSEYEKSFLEKRRAELQVERAENDLSIEQLNADAERVALAMVNDAIDRHQIKSALDGNVLEIYRQAGEWVEAGEPICRIVRMNRIRVQGYVDAAKYNPQDVAHCNVSVIAELAGGKQETFTGRIVYVGLEKTNVNGSSYLVWAEVENRSTDNQWQLLPGTEVEMTIELGSVAVARQTDQDNAHPAR